MEILRESRSHRVELEEDTSQAHQAHTSRGTYRVVDIRTGQAVFTSPNRDKAVGVFEFLAKPIAMRR